MSNEEKFRVSWIRGCDGRDVRYVDDYTLVYSAGNYLKFKSVFSGKESLPERPEPSSLGVSSIAVHPVESGLIAFADVGPNPNIFVMKHPSGERVSTLRGLENGWFFSFPFFLSFFLSIFLSIFLSFFLSFFFCFFPSYFLSFYSLSFPIIFPIGLFDFLIRVHSENLPSSI